MTRSTRSKTAAEPTPEPESDATDFDPTTPAAPTDDGGDPFDAPDRLVFPRMTDLRGRLLMIKGHKYEENVASRFEGQDPQNRVKATVVVLDGGTLHYGGWPENDDGDPPNKPHTRHDEVPIAFDDMHIFQVALVTAVKKNVGTSRWTLGRLTKAKTGTPGQSKAWILTDPDDRDKDLARKYLSEIPAF